jgi:dTDP-4-dehydrorhamnose 3,5-epimerase
MKVIDTLIDDVKIIEPRIFKDARGFFMETFRQSWFVENIYNATFVQDNHSQSIANTLRGLHYQLNNPQGKLVRVISGCVIDIAVDLRKSSSTFGHHVAVELFSQNHRQLWVPPGFAHGFYVISEQAEFVYKCTDYYTPGDEYCLVWNDAELGVDWDLAGKSPVVSDKDERGLSLKDAPYYE